MAKLRFKFLLDENNQCEQTRILIDDVDILTAIGDKLLGIVPDDFFKQEALLTTGELVIGRCACGEIRCRSAAMIVTRQKDKVFWTARDHDSMSWNMRDITSSKMEQFVFESSGYYSSVESSRSKLNSLRMAP